MFAQESVWEFDMSGRVKFGVNSVDELPSDLVQWNANSVSFITDEGIKQTGIIDEIVSTLGKTPFDVYSNVEADPSLKVFEEALDFARDRNPDVIIAVGGGSSIDVAKTTSTILDEEGKVMDYVAPPTGGGHDITGPGVPVIAIPTTAGTGSESSPVSVISVPDKQIKVGISNKHQYPDLALVDPQLTTSLPPSLTAYSGMDALSHAIEAFVTRPFDAKERPSNSSERPDYNGRTVLTDELATTAIKLISENLRRAVNNGKDLAARRNMALASLLAGIAFTNAGLGATHALALAVAGKHDSPHGLTIATLLPAVMRFNAAAEPERFENIAEFLGVETISGSQRSSALKSANAVEMLAEDVGITESLSDLGVSEDEIPELAEKSMKLERLLEGNPRNIKNKNAEAILLDAL